MPSCAVAILFGVAFASEGVRRRCFGFLAWRVCLAGNSSRLVAFCPLFWREALPCLYRRAEAFPLQLRCRHVESSFLSSHVSLLLFQSRISLTTDSYKINQRSQQHVLASK
jgi:hypothetical protein